MYLCISFQIWLFWVSMLVFGWILPLALRAFFSLLDLLNALRKKYKMLPMRSFLFSRGPINPKLQHKHNQTHFSSIIICVFLSFLPFPRLVVCLPLTALLVILFLETKVPTQDGILHDWIISRQMLQAVPGKGEVCEWLLSMSRCVFGIPWEIHMGRFWYIYLDLNHEFLPNRGRCRIKIIMNMIY